MRVLLKDVLDAESLRGQFHTLEDFVELAHGVVEDVLKGVVGVLEDGIEVVLVPVLPALVVEVAEVGATLWV